MIPCAEDIGNYALRSVGIGERLLPRSDFTLCNQVTLIGSGMIWNLYFAAMALFFGFLLQYQSIDSSKPNNAGASALKAGG